MSEALWFLAGIPVGTLGLMQYQVWKARRGMSYGEYKMKLITPKPPTIEEELEGYIEHLKDYTPIPRDLTPPSHLQKCEFCGKEFKRVSQHIRMSHKTIDVSNE